MITYKYMRSAKPERTHARAMWKALWRDARDSGVPVTGDLDFAMAEISPVLNNLHRAKLWMRRAYSDTIPSSVKQRRCVERHDVLQYLTNARLNYKAKRAAGTSRSTAMEHFMMAMGRWLPNARGKLP